jgi:hypothetical protein
LLRLPEFATSPNRTALPNFFSLTDDYNRPVSDLQQISGAAEKTLLVQSQPLTTLQIHFQVNTGSCRTQCTWNVYAPATVCLNAILPWLSLETQLPIRLLKLEDQHLVPSDTRLDRINPQLFLRPAQDRPFGLFQSRREPLCVFLSRDTTALDIISFLQVRRGWRVDLVLLYADRQLPPNSQLCPLSGSTIRVETVSQEWAESTITVSLRFPNRTLPDSFPSRATLDYVRYAIANKLGIRGEEVLLKGADLHRRLDELPSPIGLEIGVPLMQVTISEQSRQIRLDGVPVSCLVFEIRWMFYNRSGLKSRGVQLHQIRLEYGSVILDDGCYLGTIATLEGLVLKCHILPVGFIRLSFLDDQQRIYIVEERADQQATLGDVWSRVSGETFAVDFETNGNVYPGSTPLDSVDWDPLVPVSVRGAGRDPGGRYEDYAAGVSEEKSFLLSFYDQRGANDKIGNRMVSVQFAAGGTLRPLFDAVAAKVGNVPFAICRDGSQLNPETALSVLPDRCPLYCVCRCSDGPCTIRFLLPDTSLFPLPVDQTWTVQDVKSAILAVMHRPRTLPRTLGLAFWDQPLIDADRFQEYRLPPDSIVEVIELREVFDLGVTLFGVAGAFYRCSVVDSVADLEASLQREGTTGAFEISRRGQRVSHSTLLRHLGDVEVIRPASPGGSVAAAPRKFAFRHGRRNFELEFSVNCGRSEVMAALHSELRLGPDEEVTIDWPDAKSLSDLPSPIRVAGIPAKHPSSAVPPPSYPSIPFPADSPGSPSTPPTAGSHPSHNVAPVGVQGEVPNANPGSEGAPVPGSVTFSRAPPMLGRNLRPTGSPQRANPPPVPETGTRFRYNGRDRRIPVDDHAEFQTLGDQIRGGFGFDGGEIRFYFEDSMMDDEMRVYDLGDIGDTPIEVKVRNARPRAAPPAIPPAAPFAEGEVRVWFDGISRTFHYAGDTRICDLEPEIRAWRSVPARQPLRFLKSGGLNEAGIDGNVLLCSVDWSAGDLTAKVDDSPPPKSGPATGPMPVRDRPLVEFGTVPVSRGWSIRIEEQISTHEEQLENLSLRLSRFESTAGQRRLGQFGARRAPVEMVKTKLQASRTRVECPLPNQQSFYGIISFLSEKCSGNVHEHGIVRITSKSVNGDPDTSMVWKVGDIHEHHYFVSGASDEEWICWDFESRRVIVSDYTIRGCILSWIVEGSLDGANWIEVDRRRNADEMRRPPCTCSFSISNSSSNSKRTEFRLIRLRQTGENVNGEQCLRLSGFELFGILLE